MTIVDTIKESLCGLRECKKEDQFATFGRQKMRIKAKHLAAEARIIRREEGKLKGQSWDCGRTQLQQHRIGPLRSEARSTLLAYAFLKGTPYRVAERDAKSYPDVNRIISLASKYGQFKGMMPYKTAEQAVIGWLEK